MKQGYLRDTDNDDIGIVEKLLIFICALLAPFHINLVGNLYISDIILAFCLIPAHAKNAHHTQSSAAYKVCIIFMIVAIVQLFTDYFTQTPIDYILRGLARNLFIIIDLLSLFFITKGKTKYILYYIIFKLQVDFVRFVIEDEYSIDVLLSSEFSYAWKFSLGKSLYMTILLTRMLFPANRYIIASYLFGIAVMATSLILNSRSLFGFIFFSEVFSVLLTNHKILDRISQNKIGMLTAISFLSLIPYYSYTISVTSGLLGEEALEKYQFQSEIGGGNILLGGRGELIATINACLDSPIIGHGSYPLDRTGKYNFMIFNSIQDIDELKRAIEMSTSEVIPAHSIFLSLWLNVGVVGLGAGLYMLGLIIKSFINDNALLFYKKYPHYITGCIYIFISSIWDILFSPAAAYHIAHLSIGLALACSFSVVKTQHPQDRPQNHQGPRLTSFVQQASQGKRGHALS